MLYITPILYITPMLYDHLGKPSWLVLQGDKLVSNGFIFFMFSLR